MPCIRTPDGVVERRRLRRLAAVATSLSAMVATSVGAGPATASAPALRCALGRTDVHHSEGLASWNGAYPRPDHPLDAVMIFLSFPDARPALTPQKLSADYFPATTRFFDRASYGKFRLRPHIQEKWVRMPHSSRSYGIRRDWDPGRRTAYLHDAVAAAAPSVDFSRYDLVYLVADPGAPGVDSDATKVVNLDQPIHVGHTDLRRFVTVFEQSPPDRNVLAHETGHVFDLPDLYHRPQSGKGDWDTYVGDWDLMGSQFGLAPEPFAWHKWKLGWIDDRQVDCAEPSASSVHSLRPCPLPWNRATSAGRGCWWSAPDPAAPSPSRRATRPVTTAPCARRVSWSTGSATTPPRGPAPYRSSTATPAPRRAAAPPSTRRSRTRHWAWGRA